MWLPRFLRSSFYRWNRNMTPLVCNENLQHYIQPRKAIGAINAWKSSCLTISTAPGEISVELWMRKYKALNTQHWGTQRRISLLLIYWLRCTLPRINYNSTESIHLFPRHYGPPANYSYILQATYPWILPPCFLTRMIRMPGELQRSYSRWLLQQNDEYIRINDNPDLHLVQTNEKVYRWWCFSIHSFWQLPVFTIATISVTGDQWWPKSDTGDIPFPIVYINPSVSSLLLLPPFLLLFPILQA